MKGFAQAPIAEARREAYWVYFILLSAVIIVVAVLVLVALPGLRPPVFDETYCLGLLAQHEPRVAEVKLATTRMNGVMEKAGMIAEENLTLTVTIEIDRVNGVVELCRLSMYGMKELDVKGLAAEHMFRCPKGDIKLGYAFKPEYAYVGQEMSMGPEQLWKFLSEFGNASALAALRELTNYTAVIGKMPSWYGASILYMNPNLTDIHAAEITGIIGFIQLENCTGTIPDELMNRTAVIYTPPPIV